MMQRYFVILSVRVSTSFPFGTTFSIRELEYAALLETSGHRGTLGKYVELDGNVAMILSGGGASLAAMDALLATGQTC